MSKLPTTAAVTPSFELIDGAIRRVIGPHDEHDDLVQSTWLRVLERIDAGDPIDSLLAYTIGVARNVVRERIRRDARQRTLRSIYRIDLGDLTASAPTSPETQCELGEMVERLERAKLRLSSQERWLIDARFTEERDYQEMLARFQREHHARIQSTEGLRTAVFNAKKRLARSVLGPSEGPRTAGPERVRVTVREDRPSDSSGSRPPDRP